jgi:glutamyl-tRNA reductase
MRKLPEESVEHWASRVEKYEYGRALMKIAEGLPAEQVMEDMSRRIVAKLMHPLVDALRSNAKWTEADAKESAQKYKEMYMDRVGPVADHVDKDT